MNKYAGYIRVSSEEQKKEGISLKAQEERLIKFFEYEGCKDYKIYKDEGKSGGKIIGRKQYKQMISDCEQGLIKKVVVVKIDRLHRNLYNILVSLNMFKEFKIDFVSLDEKIDTSSAMGVAYLQIIGVFAEFTRNKVKDDTLSTIHYKLERGEWINKCPYGYFDLNKSKYYNDKNGKRRKKAIVLSIDETQAEKVKKLYSVLCEKKPFESSIKICNYVGITRSQLKCIIEHFKKGTYQGYITYNDKKYKGIHPPILYD